MFVFELVGDENHEVYQELEAENVARQYSFLRSIVSASLKLSHPALSIEIIKALNYHAIAGLHISAGEFRPCQVTVGPYEPPAHFQVPALMQMFTNDVNRHWDRHDDPVFLAAYVYWRLNHIHPFVNGNGRTARATAYFVLCVSSGGWLPGEKLLPERLDERRPDCVAALRHADATAKAGTVDLSPLHILFNELIGAQLNEAGIPLAVADEPPQP